MLLVVRGTPAAVDEELDPVLRGIRCRLAQGTEQIGVEVGDTRDRVVEDRHAVGDGTAGLAERTALVADHRAVGDGVLSLATRTTVLTARDVDG